MTTQTPIANIAAALAKAQKKIAVADKNATRLTEGKQTSFADMESVVTTCRDALSDQEISILQPLGGSATELLIRTVLLHSSGEFLDSEFIVRPENPNDTDAVKSLVTQMRRYSLIGMLCIATADDDGAKGRTPSKVEKPVPVQNPGPVVEKHDAEDIDGEIKMGARTVSEISTVETNEDWKEVVCHYGSDASPAKGHKLGELTPEIHKWLYEKVLPMLGKSKKDRALAEAIEEAVKGPQLPLTAPNTLPEPEKAVEPAKNAKETASSEPPKAAEAMEWRSIVAHNFKPNPKITLGEIADSAPDALAKGYDGAKILRGMKDEGIAKIQAKAQTQKDKILVNAILAANEEMDLFDEVMSKFESVGLDDEKASAHLIKNGVFEDGEKIGTAPYKMLSYLRDQWSEIEKTIKDK